MPTVNDEYKKSTEMSDAALKALAIEQYQTQAQTIAKSSYQGPTEIVELPSEGRLYPSGHPLSSGKIEMKYMTAKEEDILTNQSYIKSGVVLDKLFQSLIVTPIDYNDLLLGDKNAIMVAARILGYGSKYNTKIITPSGETQSVEIDLTQLENKTVEWDKHTANSSEFAFQLPASKHAIVVKLLTHRDSKKIDQELAGLAKIKQDAQLTTRLKHMIVEIDGNRDNATIRKFVDNDLLAIDSRAIRNFMNTVTPDIELSVNLVDEATNEPFRGSFTIGLDFFWPDARV